MNSYQKLKAKIKAKEDEIQKLLSDKEYYMISVIANEMRKSLNKNALFGCHKASGTVKFDGLLNKIKNAN